MTIRVHNPDEPLRSGRVLHSSEAWHRYCTPQYALVYVIDGAARYEDDTRGRHDVPAGSCFQRRPDELHAVAFAVGSRSAYVAIPARAYELLQQMDLPSLDAAVLHPPPLTGLLRRQLILQRELLEQAPGHQARIATRMQQWIVDVHEACRGDDRDQQFIEAACQALLSSIQTGTGLPMIAAELGYSHGTFRRRFQQLVGDSPGRWRMQRRIEHAQVLLLRGMGIESIASRLGWPDRFAFSQRFKAVVGISPGRWREQHEH